MTSPTRTPRKSKRPAKSSIFEHYDPRSYGSLQRQLDKNPKAWLATDQIIAALVANSREAIPEAVLDHLRHRLDGTAKEPQGRKKATDPASMLRGHLVPIYYARYLSWLQQRARTQGLAGWSCVRGATWWQGAPNERAARMVQAKLMRSVDWRHVMNLVSKSHS